MHWSKSAQKGLFLKLVKAVKTSKHEKDHGIFRDGKEDKAKVVIKKVEM